MGIQMKLKKRNEYVVRVALYDMRGYRYRNNICLKEVGGHQPTTIFYSSILQRYPYHCRV
nr:MAG TPA: hypothetical protein [Caudoviricetes sp.]